MTRAAKWKSMFIEFVLTVVGLTVFAQSTRLWEIQFRWWLPLLSMVGLMLIRQSVRVENARNGGVNK